MVKARKIKVKSTENEEIIMAMTTINNHNHNDENENKNWLSYKNIKKLRQNKKCSSKSYSYLLKREKRSESQVGYIIPTINCYPRNK